MDGVGHGGIFACVLHDSDSNCERSPYEAKRKFSHVWFEKVSPNVGKFGLR